MDLFLKGRKMFVIIICCYYSQLAAYDNILRFDLVLRPSYISIRDNFLHVCYKHAVNETLHLW